MKRKEESFVIVAVSFCDFIESCSTYNEKKTLMKFLRILSQLYAEALVLPIVEPKEEHLVDRDFPLPKVDFKNHNVYTEMFNPYLDKMPVSGCLDDDILDIYRDIKSGLILYEQGKHTEAIWEWKVGFEIHWGEHATSAIRALHSIHYQ